MKLLSFLALFSSFILVGVLFFSLYHSGYASENFNDVNYSISVGSLDPIGGASNAKAGKQALEQILKNIADILLFTIPILGGIALLVAGYFYIFSGGQSDMVGKAKVIIKWNLIAILVAFFSYGIITIIASFF